MSVRKGGEIEAGRKGRKGKGRIDGGREVGKED